MFSKINASKVELFFVLLFSLLLGIAMTGLVCGSAFLLDYYFNFGFKELSLTEVWGFLVLILFSCSAFVFYSIIKTPDNSKVVIYEEIE